MQNSPTRQGPPVRRRLVALLTGAVILSGGLIAGTVLPAAAAEDCATVPWMDTTKSSEARASALLDASTQHQKYRWLVEQPANSPQQTTWSGGVTYPVQVPCTPTVIYANGPDGVYAKAGTTAWPGPIAVASTWNLELGEQKAAAHGSESFDSRSAVVLGPGIASGRTPLSGRGSEYFGEDALLSGLMAAANVKGLEQGNPDKPVVANLKHYVANEQETDREESSSNIDERTFRQVYDLPYEIAVKESDPGSVMCSYNQINGVYACENPVLTTSLDQQMGFDGYVMSDFGSVHSTAASLDAGLDQELNRPVFYTPALLDAALAAGEITQEQIDQAAFDVVHTYIEKGLFDHPVPATAIPNVSTAEHKALARDIAEQSTVLLKNDGAAAAGRRRAHGRRHRPDRVEDRDERREREDRLRLVPRVHPRHRAQLRRDRRPAHRHHRAREPGRRQRGVRQRCRPRAGGCGRSRGGCRDRVRPLHDG